MLNKKIKKQADIWMSKTRSELNTVVESETLSKTVKDIPQSELHSVLTAACMCRDKLLCTWRF